MEQITRGGAAGEVVRVGVDLAKRVIQVHAVDAHRARGRAPCAAPRAGSLTGALSLPAGCVVAMETSSSAHHWARKLVALGLDAAAHRPRSWSSPTAARARAARTTPTTRRRSARRPRARRCASCRSSPSSSRACCACTGCAKGSRKTAPPASTASAACWPSSAWSSRRAPRRCSSSLADVLEDAGNEMGTLARRLTLQRAQAQWRELDDAPRLVRRAHRRSTRADNAAGQARPPR